jgi:cytochrome c
VVSANGSPRFRVALALAILLLGACDTRPPAATADAPARRAAPSPGPRGAAEPAAARSEAVFDVGEIKTAAEYLLEPELAAADLKRGELLSLACAACHTFGAGQQTLIGPNLHAVFGRPAAALADFSYSPALRASRLVWTPRALEAWLADPATFVAGTTMTFSGYRSAADRRDLIAYLLHATQ